MFNLKINCVHPWLWLLLIPAVALTLFTYFRVAKKYRRTRNRVVSMVMHLLVTVLCVAVLANVTLQYEVYNDQNEIILVVDNSYSTEQQKTSKDEYVKDVVMMTDPNAFKIGIVSFGYDYKLVADLSNDIGAVLDAYNAETQQPDIEATDIAEAVTYAASLFNNKQSAKIIIVSDGFETDDNAMSAVRNAVAEGIKVDTVCLSPNDSKDDVFSVVSCETPDYNVAEEEVFPLKLTVTNSSSKAISAKIALTDNNELASETVAEIKPGTQVVEIKHALVGEGLHTFNFTLTSEASESATQNNQLYSYMLLNKFDKVLIIEGFAGESTKLKELLADYQVKTVYIGSTEMPTTLDELCQYDEVILNNVSNADLQKHEGLDKLLNAYVYDIGGGLFTVGGNEKSPDSDGNDVAHSYNRDDMEGSLYQQMLPVQIIDYTPPLGLYIILDISGSMTDFINPTKDTALTIISDPTCLSERDYCGIMTLSDDADNITSKPLPVTRQSELRKAISEIGNNGGGTNFAPSIEYAADNLKSLNSTGVIEKMHIIIITDGIAGDVDASSKDIEAYYDQGITFSFLVVDRHSPSENDWDSLTEAGKLNWYNVNGPEDLTEQVKNDLRVPQIKEVEQKEFTPKVNANSAYASILGNETLPVLDGFYGAKAREDTEVLYGDYGVPVYAEWKYGAGTVGSFMCDLNGNWSSKFMADKTGQKFLYSAINKVFPTEDIRPKEITVSMRDDNFSTNLNVKTKTELKEGEKLTMKSDIAESTDFALTQPDATSGFNRASIYTRQGGVYAVTIQKLAADGSVLASTVVYRVFSYSKEFTYYEDATKGAALMAQMAQAAGGNAQNAADGDFDAARAFDGFITSIPKTFDPRWLFMILAIVCFLIDIAVRKFKFKWPHEIIREMKQKKEEQKGNTN